MTTVVATDVSDHSERSPKKLLEADLVLSVIIPLPDHQGHAEPSVRSFAHGQSLARDRYEVIVMTDGRDRALEAKVKALLGPRDRMVRHTTDNLHLLYNLGAREASGTILLVTEPHCIGEPNCLEELARYFAANDVDAACCRSLSMPPANGWSRAEEHFFDPHLTEICGPGDWRKVLVRGFAIYRDIYFKEGGFQHAYGRFSEHELAARLHERGYRMGYAATAAIRHSCTTSPRQLFSSVRNHTWGEIAYRAQAPREYCERYFGVPEEWARREALRPGPARALCRASWQALRGAQGWVVAVAQARVLFRTLPVALLGPRWAMLRAQLALRAALARTWLWRLHNPRLFAAYRDVHAGMVRLSRLAAITEHLATTAPAPPPLLTVQPAEVHDEWLLGFHAVERWGDEPFRWSGPVALLRLGLPKATYAARIETRALRQAPVPLCLQAFFNRHKLPAHAFHWDDGALVFWIGPSMFVPGPEQQLVLTCNPLRPWTLGVPDRRELGLPIFSIAFTPAEPTVGTPEQAASAMAHAISAMWKSS